MIGKQKCACGVVVKSHPKSHIKIVYSDDELFCSPTPKHLDRNVVILQVAPANDGARFIVEFVYEDKYNDILKEQI